MAEALRHNERGVRAEARGRPDEALAEFGEALRCYRSVEDREGVAAELINISRTCRLRGNLGAAREFLAQAGEADLLPQHLAAELLFERAKLALAEGDPTTADRYVLKLRALQGEAAPAMTHNLAGMILLRLGKPQDALREATIALRLAQGAGHRVEEANAYRLLAGCHAAVGNRQQAEEAYARALALDRELANPRKIADDLRGLGEIAARYGDSDQAIAFFRRACTVSSNAGDTFSAVQDLQRIEELYRKTGRSADAEQAARLRETLARDIGATGGTQHPH
jgi:tetratricopeptide (TPR) repeat protein